MHRLLIFTLFATSAFAAPELNVEQAAALAQGHLRERGMEAQVHVSQLAIESTSLTKGPLFWYAKWSQSVALEENKTELGLRINMDGTLVRVVESPATKTLRKHYRTRSDRPSILDLK